EGLQEVVVLDGPHEIEVDAGVVVEPLAAGVAAFGADLSEARGDAADRDRSLGGVERVPVEQAVVSLRLRRRQALVPEAPVARVGVGDVAEHSRQPGGLNLPRQGGQLLQLGVHEQVCRGQLDRRGGRYRGALRGLGLRGVATYLERALRPVLELPADAAVEGTDPLLDAAL